MTTQGHFECYLSLTYESYDMFITTFMIPIKLYIKYKVDLKYKENCLHHSQFPDLLAQYVNSNLREFFLRLKFNILHELIYIHYIYFNLIPILLPDILAPSKRSLSLCCLVLKGWIMADSLLLRSPWSLLVYLFSYNSFHNNVVFVSSGSVIHSWILTTFLFFPMWL